MSDRERSRSRNGSAEPVMAKAPKISRVHSRSRSRTPPPPHKSHKKYISPERYSRSRSRSGSLRRGVRARYSRSRSRSYSPRGSYRRSHSHSPMSSRRRHLGDRRESDGLPRGDDADRRRGGGAPVDMRARLEKQRERQAMMENPQQSRCLGVFGLSLYTSEQQINHIFSKYGPVERVQVVIDAKTGRSRGFCFVYMDSMDDAKLAKNECSGMEIDGRRIRVDFSITQRAHTPTPGIYMGKPTFSNRDNGYGERRRDRDDYYGGGRSGGGYRERERERDYYRSSYHRRSPSPHYRGRPARRYDRERSYSPRRY